MKISIKWLFVTCITVTFFGCGEAATNTDNTNANNRTGMDSASSNTGLNKAANQTGTDTAASNPVSNNSDAATQASPEDCKKLGGSIFRYKYEGSPDELTFTIVFQCKNDSLKGLMFGPDPEGEEGTYYFKENLNGLQVINNTISFHLAYENLYKLPFTLDNYNKNFPNKVLGGSNEVMYFKGPLAGDSIVLHCDAPDGVCYDKTMVFKKK